MKKIVSLLVFPLLLTSCNKGSEDYKRILCPSGAPSICFYDYPKDSYFKTNSTPANVLSSFKTDDFGTLVFDFYNGLKILSQNESGKEDDYKLVRILTGGNLYLVGIDKETSPTADDYIVSFGENLLPDLVYKKLFPNLLNSTHYVSSVNEVLPVLKTGLHSGNKVDYVLIAQPALFAATNDKEANTYNKTHVISCLKDDWYDFSKQSGIPQAGLFIKKKYYKNHKDYFDSLLNRVDNAIEEAINNPQNVKEEMNKNFPNIQDQTDFYGFNSNIVYNVQKDNKNGFALVDKTTSSKIDVIKFLTLLGVSGEYSQYIGLDD